MWKDEAAIGKEVQYVGQIVAAVAATTEEIATKPPASSKSNTNRSNTRSSTAILELSKGNPTKETAMWMKPSGRRR